LKGSKWWSSRRADPRWRTLSEYVQSSARPAAIADSDPAHRAEVSGTAAPYYHRRNRHGSKDLVALAHPQSLCPEVKMPFQIRSTAGRHCPDTLIESSSSGHLRGSFITDAHQQERQVFAAMAARSFSMRSATISSDAGQAVYACCRSARIEPLGAERRSTWIVSSV